MKHPETHRVTEDHGPRPAGQPDQCFYCGQALGQEHKPDCVMRKRTVVLQFTVEMTVEVPEFWTPEQIEFHRNESSYCSGNVVGELSAAGCLCSTSHFEFLREANEEDDKKFGRIDLGEKPEPPEVREALRVLRGAAKR